MEEKAKAMRTNAQMGAFVLKVLRECKPKLADAVCSGKDLEGWFDRHRRRVSVELHGGGCRRRDRGDRRNHPYLLIGIFLSCPRSGRSPLGAASSPTPGTCRFTESELDAKIPSAPRIVPVGSSAETCRASA